MPLTHATDSLPLLYATDTCHGLPATDSRHWTLATDSLPLTPCQDACHWLPAPDSCSSCCSIFHVMVMLNGWTLCEASQRVAFSNFTEKYEEESHKTQETEKSSWPNSKPFFMRYCQGENVSEPLLYACCLLYLESLSTCWCSLFIVMYIRIKAWFIIRKTKSPTKQILETREQRM